MGALGLAVVAAVGTEGLTAAAPPQAALAAGPGGTAATPQTPDVFLRIAGADGESTNAAHKGWIDVQSWSWGLSQPNAGIGSAVAAGPWVGHVTVVKRIDKATPPLFQWCSDGTVLALVTVELARPGGGPAYLKYELQDALVTSITHGDVDGDGVPEETVMLDFTGGKLTYTQLDTSGKPAGQTSAEGGSVPVLR